MGPVKFKDIEGRGWGGTVIGRGVRQGWEGIMRAWEGLRTGMGACRSARRGLGRSRKKKGGVRDGKES